MAEPLTNRFGDRIPTTEHVYLKGYASMGELLLGGADYFAFNGVLPYQSLPNKMPDVVYRSAIGGGAMIVDKFGGAVEHSICLDRDDFMANGNGITPLRRVARKRTRSQFMPP